VCSDRLAPVDRFPRAVVGGLVAIGSRLTAIPGGLDPVGDSSGAVVGRIVAVSRRPDTIALGTRNRLLTRSRGASVQIAQVSLVIPILRSAITKHSRTITILSRLQPRLGALVARLRDHVTVTCSTITLSGHADTPAATPSESRVVSAADACSGTAGAFALWPGRGVAPMASSTDPPFSG
jgi:hypothetical protein